MKEVEFNLLEEPWIRLLRPDCRVEEVSLAEALYHAQDYRDLAGELPTQDFALLRLLLAVLHGVFGRVDASGQPGEITSPKEAVLRWKSLWQLGHFPKKPIGDYLEKWHDRFWLFHPERPFWQVPEAAIGTEYSAAKLNGELAESGNKLRLFPAYAGAGKREMSYGQAARWLLYVNGFDDTSAKPKGKGLPSTGAGWLGKLGLIQAQGKNLFETLMLNLTLLQDGNKLWGKGCPCWELPERRGGERIQIPLPDNPAALLTLQSRRLLLYREEGDKVTGYSLLGGDFFPRENALAEQMTVWRTSQEKKDGPIVYLPKRHDPAKQFWREFPAVFSQTADTRPPGIVSWIVQLQNPQDGCLDRRSVIHFRIVGVAYGDKDFFVTDTFSDGLSFHAALLDELGMRWRRLITKEIRFCEKVAGALGFLAGDLAIAAGGGGNSAPQAARERFYYEIDLPFRQWLQDIDPDWDVEETEESIRSWRAKAQQIARSLGHQMVFQAGNAAFTGRWVSKEGQKGKKKEEKVFYSAPKAYNIFLASIKTIYKEKGGA